MTKHLQEKKMAEADFIQNISEVMEHPSFFDPFQPEKSS